MCSLDDAKNRYLKEVAENGYERDYSISRIDKVKNVIRNRYINARCGLFFTPNWIGDPMSTIWEEDGVTIDICYDYEYFEVFGLTEEEENELLAFYNSLRLERTDFRKEGAPTPPRDWRSAQTDE